MLFKGVGSTDRSEYFQDLSQKRIIHLVPFKNTYKAIAYFYFGDFEHPQASYYRLIIIRNIVGNLFLFFPWGIMGPLLFKSLKSAGRVFLSTLLISFLAESIQFYFRIGIFDIDDILYNTTGAVLGYYTLKLVLSVFERKKKTVLKREKIHTLY